MLIALLLVIAGPLLRYDVRESVSATTPRGSDDRALVGRTTVAGENVLWELTAGTFPRSSAQAALVDRGAVTLLNRKEGVYAAASREDFDALFVPRTGDETGASFTPRDVAVSVEPEGEGRPFLDSPTHRWRVEAKWRLAVQAPGRAGSVESELSGTIVAAPELAGARTPFDDPLRLVPVRGTVREALARELSKVKGLPVTVSLTLTTEARSERLGAAPGPPDGAARTPRTQTRILRELSNPQRRPAREADGALFVVPPEFHSRALERLAPSVVP